MRALLIACYLIFATSTIVVADNRIISKLESELAEAESIESSSQARRAYKRILRQAERIDSHGPAEFRILNIILQSQQKLYELQPGDELRRALIESAQRLSKAPDTMADVRLSAYTILLQRSISIAKDKQSKALAVAKVADRYRDTKAELESLILSAEATFNIGHEKLLQSIRATLTHKFQDNPDAQDYLKERFAFISRETNKGIMDKVRIALKNEKYQEALELLNQIPDHKVHTSQHFVLAHVKYGLKKWDEALEHINYYIHAHEKWSKNHGDCCHSLAAALRVRAAVYKKSGEKDKAQADSIRQSKIQCPAGMNQDRYISKFEKKYASKLPPLNSPENLKKALKHMNDIILHNGDKKQSRRQGIASWIKMRGKIYKAMGKHKESQRDLDHAEALTKGIPKAKPRKRSAPSKQLTVDSYTELVLSTK